MDKKKRSNLAFGLLLILVGGWFTAVQFYPNLQFWSDLNFDWPVFIIGGGLLFLIFGLLFGIPAFAIPASIIGGIGGLLYYQNATGNWESWSYAWSLIPGFVGIGVIIAAVLGEGGKEGYKSGFTLLLISIVLFVVFGSFLGNTVVDQYWPVLLIIGGVWILIRSWVRRK